MRLPLLLPAVLAAAASAAEIETPRAVGVTDSAIAAAQRAVDADPASFGVPPGHRPLSKEAECEFSYLDRSELYCRVFFDGQRHQGVRVDWTGLELHLEGVPGAFEIEAYPRYLPALSLSVAPTLSRDAAAKAIVGRMISCEAWAFDQLEPLTECPIQASEIQPGGELVIFAGVDLTYPPPALAWYFRVLKSYQQPGPNGLETRSENWLVYVDAHTGETLFAIEGSKVHR